MKQSIGLVLSGGGVRGAAHIGFLKALEHNGIYPSHLSGSSSGAIVGAFYAAGYTPDQILEFFIANADVFQWSKMTLRKPGILDTDKYEKVLLPYLGGRTFENLNKRLYVAATDVQAGVSRIFKRGELIRPVLASSALPPVFAPVEINGTWYIDGGVMNNFPVEPLRKCDRVLGSFVATIRPLEKEDLSNPIKLLHRSNDLHYVAHSTDKFNDCDFVLQPKSLYKYGNFNSNHIQDVFEIGYMTALDQMEEILETIKMPIKTSEFYPYPMA